MNRSDINKVIIDMEALAERFKFSLPPFAFWEPEDWLQKGVEFNEIRENKLGWDITDFGSNDFFKVGLALLTIRNGNLSLQHKYPKPYAEKLLMLYEGQSVPLHYHKHKMEDIINRGGNVVEIRLFNASSTGEVLNTPVNVSQDGRNYTVDAGTSITLSPGESLTIPQYLYHSFHVPPSGGSVLIGEVSMCNDDENDNFFSEQVGRFPKISEDAEPYRLLCNEYPNF